MEREKMEKTVIAEGIICIVFVLLLSINGCAHVPQKITSPPVEEIKIDFGKMGVVSPQFQPVTNFKKPKGKMASAAAGAGTGVLLVGTAAGAVVVAAPYSFVLVIYPPVAAGIGCAAGGAALIGGVVGAVVGESSKNIKKTDETLNEVIIELNVHEKIQDEFVSIFRKQPLNSFYHIQGKGPNTLDEEVSYAFLTNEGIDSVLEICALRFGLWGEKGLNPPLHFFMTVRTRFIRVADGAVLYTKIFRYEGGRSKFTDWATNNGQLFRDEFGRACQTLAKEIAEKVNRLRKDNKGQA
jgi:hypothetical protein